MSYSELLDWEPPHWALLILQSDVIRLRDELERDTFGVNTRFVRRVCWTTPTKSNPTSAKSLLGMTRLGRTPLGCAIDRRSIEIARLLLEHKADVEEECWGKYTPLGFACHCDDEKMVDLLLCAGADQTRSFPLVGVCWNVAFKRMYRYDCHRNQEMLVDL